MLFLPFILTLTPLAAFPQGPVISEFLASNQDGIEDEDGDSSDWIEIHNPRASSIDLGGGYLTDDAGNLTRWAFPMPTTLGPGSSIVVFASNKNRAVSGQELHTDFKLSASGEYLALVQSDGVTIQSQFAPEFPLQYPDISYGLRFNPSPQSDESYFAAPTPGAPNGTGGPCVQEVTSSPEFPSDQDDIIVTARILGATVPVANATLTSRVMYGFESSVSFADDGIAPDLVAGDELWTATIPASASTPGEMVRWKVLAQDSGNLSGLAPLHLTAESAEYFGTVIADPNVTSALPTIYWFVENPSLADTTTGTQCSLWHLGEFYDNQFCRKRGASTAKYKKKSYKIDFNPGEKFRMFEEHGRMEEINLNTTWTDKSYLRQLLSAETYHNSGLESSLASMVHLRQNIAFKGLYTFIEQVDDELLERLQEDPDGALYKMGNALMHATANVEKKTRTWEGNQDLQDLVDGVDLNNSVADFERYLFDNIDLPKVLSYLVGTSLMNDNDHMAKNYYLYRDSDGDREWSFLPWDKDLTFGRNWTQSGGVNNDSMWADIDPQCHPLFGDQGHPSLGGWWNRLINACYSVPRIQEMYVRRLWTVMEQELQDPNTPASNLIFENHIDALQQLLATEVTQDVQVWGSPSWGTSMTFQQAIDQLKQDYLEPRRVHLYQTHTQSGVLPGHPSSPPLILLGSMEPDPVSGNDDEEWLELINPTLDAVDMSGWTLTGGIDFDFAPGTVVPAGDSVYLSPDLFAFRSRASSPKGGEGNFVVGPHDGNLKPGEDLFLWDQAGTLITTNSTTFTLFVGDFIGGADVTLSIAGATPNSSIYIGWSRTGAGPTSTPWGNASLSAPISALPPLQSNSSGTASIQAAVPNNYPGLQIWLQALDIPATSFSNGESRTIQ